MSEVLDFDKQDGLIAAIVQDSETHRVLIVGYMNREAFDKTITPATHFLSVPARNSDQRRKFRPFPAPEIHCHRLRWRRLAGSG